MRKWTPLKRHPGIYEYNTDKGKRFGTKRSFKSATGRRKYWSKSGFMTWRDADISLKKFEADLASGTLTESMTQTILLKQYFETVKKRKLAMNIWRQTTADQKDHYWKRISPVFGDTPIGDIKRQPYQRFIDRLVKEGLARTTIVTINSVMQILMNDAEHNNVITKNPLKSIEITTKRRPRSQSLTEDDFRRLMYAAKDILLPYQYGMFVLLTLGERREELMGLRLGSFQFAERDGNEICAIKFDLSRTRNDPNGGPLKNPSSYRTIYVTGQYCDTCHFMINQCLSICRKHNIIPDENTFLILNEVTGDPYYPEYPEKITSNLQKATGIQIHPHTLRHFFATHALSSGQSSTDVMHWLGHSSIATTVDYTRENERGALTLFEGMQSTLLPKE